MVIVFQRHIKIPVKNLNGSVLMGIYGRLRIIVFQTKEVGALSVLLD